MFYPGRLYYDLALNVHAVRLKLNIQTPNKAARFAIFNFKPTSPEFDTIQRASGASSLLRKHLEKQSTNL